MLTRTLHTTTVGRAASMRRLRRRQTVSDRLFCSTNGCASFLEIDAGGHTAVCPICGFRRRLFDSTDRALVAHPARRRPAGAVETTIIDGTTAASSETSCRHLTGHASRP